MKICIIGKIGHVHQTYHEMRCCPEAEFVGISCGSEYESTEELGGYNLPIYQNYQEMLDCCHPDVAVVAPVYGRAGSIIIDCAQRGIDVFSEKPVAGTLTELEAVEKAVKKHHIHFSAMHFLRFTPSFYHAQKMTEAGAIGDIQLITAQKSYRFGTRPDWYRNRSLYTGTIPWVGIHAIDWIQFFSKKDFCSVTALHTGNPEMTALCQFELADHVFASANIDYLRPQAAPTHGDDRTRVAGTKGIIEVFQDHFTLINENGEQTFRPDSAPKLACDYLNHREELTSEDIFAVTRAALTARDAADQKKTLEIG